MKQEVEFARSARSDCCFYLFGARTFGRLIARMWRKFAVCRDKIARRRARFGNGSIGGMQARRFVRSCYQRYVSGLWGCESQGASGLAMPGIAWGRQVDDIQPRSSRPTAAAPYIKPVGPVAKPFEGCQRHSAECRTGKRASDLPERSIPSPERRYHTVAWKISVCNWLSLSAICAPLGYTALVLCRCGDAADTLILPVLVCAIPVRPMFRFCDASACY